MSATGRWGAGTWILLAVAACGAQSPAPDRVRGSILAFGTMADWTPPERVADPQAPGGWVWKADRIEITKETGRIEARIGTSFGYQFQIEGLRPGSEITLTKSVSYPPMTRPDGTVASSHRRPLEPTVVRSDGTVSATQGYSFDEPYELLPGPWTIEIWLGDQLLTSKTFNVVLPPDPPED